MIPPIPLCNPYSVTAAESPPPSPPPPSPPPPSPPPSPPPPRRRPIPPFTGGAFSPKMGRVHPNLVYQHLNFFMYCDVSETYRRCYVEALDVLYRCVSVRYRSGIGHRLSQIHSNTCILPIRLRIKPIGGERNHPPPSPPPLRRRLLHYCRPRRGRSREKRETTEAADQLKVRKSLSTTYSSGLHTAENLVCMPVCVLVSCR